MINDTNSLWLRLQKPFKLHPTSIWYIFNVYEHSFMWWMGIWMHSYMVTNTSVAPGLGWESIEIVGKGLLPCGEGLNYKPQLAKTCTCSYQLILTTAATSPPNFNSIARLLQGCYWINSYRRRGFEFHRSGHRDVLLRGGFYQNYSSTVQVYEGTREIFSLHRQPASIKHIHIKESHCHQLIPSLYATAMPPSLSSLQSASTDLALCDRKGSWAWTPGEFSLPSSLPRHSLL